MVAATQALLVQQPQDASAETRLYPPPPALGPHAPKVLGRAQPCRRSDHPWPCSLICARYPHGRLSVARRPTHMRPALQGQPRTLPVATSLSEAGSGPTPPGRETAQGQAAPVPHAWQGQSPERLPGCPDPTGPRPPLHPPAGRPELREGLAEEAQRLLSAAVPGRHVRSSRARAGGASSALEEPLPGLLRLRGRRGPGQGACRYRRCRPGTELGLGGCDSGSGPALRRGRARVWGTRGPGGPGAACW